MERKRILVYTDGSACVKGINKGKAGFACYFPDYFDTGHKAWAKGMDGKTGEMEVTALWYAIMAMPVKSDVPLKLVVYSDSEYVVKSFTEGWLKKWLNNNFNNGATKNKLLWHAIWANLERRKDFMNLEMHHIKSHQVDKEKNLEKKKLLMKNPHIIGNMMADKLADYKRFL